MLCATISLPQPLSPVTSTLASERATRSISSRSATISGLWPISRTAVFVINVTNDVLDGCCSLARETLEDVPLLVREIDEAGPDLVALSVRALCNPPHLDFGGKGLARQIETQPSP